MTPNLAARHGMARQSPFASIAVGLVLAASSAAAAPPTTSGDASAFAAEIDVSMAKMMKGMHVRPSGDVDRDFARMMIAHHQGAIEMALAELRHGRDPRLRRIAQEIVVEQHQEIAVMQAVLDEAQTRPATAIPTAVAVPMSRRDRVYVAEQFSNTVSVVDPIDHKLLGVIRLGDPSPANFSALYRGQVLVHGMGYSPDRRTLVVVSIGSNSVTFIDTATNAVLHTTYVGRSPHEAFFTPDGGEVWVTVRGESHVAVLDAKTYAEKTRIAVPDGPGMQIFSPDGRYGYVCSSFTPETVIVEVATHRIVGRVAQESPFCPNIAATPDGRQVWFTLKDIGRVMVFDARPPFAVLRSIDTGPITNHVNFARTARGTLAYVSVGALNEVRVYRTDDFSEEARIPVGKLPHGVWPSGDGARIYVGLENGDALQAIDTATNTIVAETGIGPAPQALVYVPNAVPEGAGLAGLQPIGVGGQATHIVLGPGAPTSVTLFDQGFVQVLEASASGLVPMRAYVLALSRHADGSGPLEVLASFTANPVGAAIVNSIGPLRQIVRADLEGDRRWLVIAAREEKGIGEVVQVQVP